MNEFPAALAPMANYRQFLIWKPVYKADRIDKIPLHPMTGEAVDAHDQSAWVTAEEAINSAALWGDNIGIAFTFTENDPFFFLDIDDCIKNGQYTDIANELAESFPGAAIELSTSKKGLHIFGFGKPLLESKSKQRKIKSSAGFDLYTESRFVALTGDILSGDMGQFSYDDNLNALVNKYLMKSPESMEGFDWTSTHCEGSHPIENDDELIEKMLNSTSAASNFGGKASPRDLWERNVEVLGRIFPDTQGMNPFDRSAADAALIAHLAFWTGKNCERIDRLFRRSMLMRDKWETRSDYRLATITGACAACQGIFGKIDKPKSIDEVAEPQIKMGYQFLSVSQQIEWFQGCVYVRDLHKVLTPDGALLDMQRFKVTYGGYQFAMGSDNEKTTKNAWEAFTESQGVTYPWADCVAFRPENEFGEILKIEGKSIVNTYRHIDIEMKEGDPTPLLRHLELMIPNERDREILLSYMAACVQHKGVKFQWTPLLQGVEGNGKSLFMAALIYAVGDRYSHKPNASDLAGNGTKFTGWLQGKLLIGVEEIYVSDRREVSDALKPLITDKRIEIQTKGADQVMGDNRANFFMCSNHKDAIVKTRRDRRYCVFYTAQQNNEDMMALGWTDAAGNSTAYFPNLYKWCEKEGFAIFANYLMNYQIKDELNPAKLCVRAPVTSTTEEAFRVSLGTVEQEIIEAVENGAYGFQGGWISSIKLSELLEAKRLEKRVPMNKRKEILWELGYHYHPNLYEGRVNNDIPLEGGKPRLFIKRGHVAENLTQCSEIVEKYMHDQNSAHHPVNSPVTAFKQ